MKPHVILLYLGLTIICAFTSCFGKGRKHLVFDSEKLTIQPKEDDYQIISVVIIKHDSLGGDTLFSHEFNKKAPFIDLLRLSPELKRLKQNAEPNQFERDYSLNIYGITEDSIEYFFRYTFDLEQNNIVEVTSEGYA